LNFNAARFETRESHRHRIGARLHLSPAFIHRPGLGTVSV
jgi:hypothetical protein